MNDRTPRIFWIPWIVGTVVAVVFGIQQHRDGHQGLFVAWVVFGVVSCPIWWSVARRRQPSEPGELTGTSLDVTRAGQSDAWVGQQVTLQGVKSWTGGANVPGPMGRINSTYPLAVLKVAPEGMTLRLRPRIVARLVGASGFTATPSEMDLIFPVKGWTSGGVGLVRHGAPVVYFFTRQRLAILNALVAAGFRVSPEERRFQT